MKLKTTLYVYHNQYAWEKQASYDAFTFIAGDNETRTLVGEQEIELNIPDDYDPRAQQIAALVASKQELMADYHKSITTINDKISKLQALEYTA